MEQAVKYDGERRVMERFSQLVADVWREACRHIEISEAVDLIAPLLTRHLPVDAVLVRRLELDRDAVDTLAVTTRDHARLAIPLRSECPAEQLDRLADWCRRGGVVRQPADLVRDRLPGLVPEGIEGEVLAGPLMTE